MNKQRLSKWPFILAIGHTLILACYALPGQLVPDRLEYWSSTYTRPLFHQQWNLFAPDVPPCGCTIVVTESGTEIDLMEGEGLMERRLIKWGCRSMHNYRDVTDTAEFIPWQGFDRYLDVMVEAPRRDSVAVVRTCYNGHDQRTIRRNTVDD